MEKISIAIEFLRGNSRDEEKLREAYWQIEYGVIEDGVLLETALPTIQTLLILMSECSPYAKPHVLELIEQISLVHTYEQKLFDKVMSSISNHENFFYDELIENSSINKDELCLNILFALADKYVDLKPRFCRTLKELALADDVHVTKDYLISLKEELQCDKLLNI